MTSMVPVVSKTASLRAVQEELFLAFFVGQRDKALDFVQGDPKIEMASEGLPSGVRNPGGQQLIYSIDDVLMDALIMKDFTE